MSILQTVRSLLFLFFGAVAPLWCIDSTLPFADYVHQQWTRAQGLPPGTLIAITQTRDGYVWLGTEASLVRFDGVRFKKFDRYNTPDLGTTSVVKLLALQSGDLWVLLKDRLVRMRGTSAERIRGLGSMAVMGLAEDKDGQVWALTREGQLYQFDGRQMTLRRMISGIVALALAIDASNRFWVGTQDGLLRLDSAQQDAQRIDELQGTPIYDVVKAQDGGVWFVTQASGVGHVGPRAIERIGAAQGLPEKVVNVVEASDGGLWAFAEGGIFKFLKGKHRGALRSSNFGPIFIDMEGALWSGGYQGLHRFKEGFFVTRRVSEPPIEPVPTWAVLPTGKDTGLAGVSRLGLVRVTDGGIFQPSDWAGKIRNTIYQFARDHSGNTWVTSRDGLFRLDSQQRLVRVSPTPTLAVIVDTADRVWFSCAEGVCLWDHGHQTIPVPLDRFKNPTIFCLLMSRDGTLWIGTNRQGLLAYSNGTLRNIWNGDGGASVTSIHEDADGTLWMGSEGHGLLRHSAGRVSVIDRRQGLPTDQISSVVEDDDACIWLASNMGIIRAKKFVLQRAFDDPKGPVATLLYDSNDGLPASDLSGYANALSWRDGRLWAATAEGIGISRVGLAHDAIAPPQPRIEEVLADGIETKDNSGVVPPGTRRIEIYFSAPRLSDANKILFRYRLADLDPVWNDPGSRLFAAFINVPPGDHRFEVQALSPATGMPAKTASLELRVAPLFYQSKWFYALCAAVLGLVVWLGHHARVQGALQRMDAVYQERIRLSGELHDTVVQGLSGAMFELEGVRAGLAALDPESEAKLARTLENLRRSARDARYSLSELRSPALAGGDIVAALEELSIDGSADIKLSRKVVGVPVRLPGTLAHDFYRIAQEAVTNALRHSEAPEVSVLLCFEPGIVSIEVRDQGKGFDIKTVGGQPGIGLKVMRERAERAGGDLFIDSQPGRGTLVRVARKL